MATILQIILKSIFLCENYIFTQISIKSVPKILINNKPALVQIVT